MVWGCGGLLEFGVAHIAGFVEGVVEREGGGKGVGGLSSLAEFEVFAQERTIVRVRAVVDDAFGALNGVKSAQVGNALVGDEDVDGVFGVVLMSNHGDDVADAAALGYGGAGEDAQVGVAGKVAGAADTIHHLGAEHMG